MFKNNFLRKIIKMFFEKKKEMFLIILFLSILAILGFIRPYFEAKLITAISKIEIQNILIYASLIFIFFNISNILNIYSSRIRTIYLSVISLNIKRYLYKELLTLETKNFDHEGTNFFISRTTDEAEGIVYNLFSSFEELTSIVSSCGALVYVYFINFYFGIYFTLGIIIFICLKNKELKLWETRRERIYDKSNSNASSFNEMIRGIRDVKVLNLSRNMLDRIFKNDEKLLDLELEDDKLTAKFSILANIISNAFELFILVLGVLLIINKQMAGASLIVIYTYRKEISSLQYSVTYFLSVVKKLKVATGHVTDILENPKYPHEQFGDINLDKVQGDIEFRNVTFKYDQKNVLNNVSFHIKPNETIGIVGKSGSGKTTIFNLLSKLYDVNDNQIFIDGVDINKLSEDTIRNNISAITQNPYIFNLSVKDNIRLVNPKVKNSEIIEKSKLAVFDEIANKLPNKYDTIIGEGGVILSGGERQRLAITRALVKNSEIILLDEATSSLDNETQNNIQESIRKISQDYTIIIIAHRLSTIKNCDRIIVLNNGKIVGEGTHDELIKNNKYYKTLYEKDLI